MRTLADDKAWEVSVINEFKSLLEQYKANPTQELSDAINELKGTLEQNVLGNRFNMDLPLLKNYFRINSEGQLERLYKKRGWKVINLKFRCGYVVFDLKGKVYKVSLDMFVKIISNMRVL